MTAIELWEIASYIVTVVGLPLAILVFVLEQRKERENDEEEVYQLLSDNYQEFLRTALEHAHLRLFSTQSADERTPEQREQVFIIYSMLVSLFERAYLLLHERSMSEQQSRRWLTWEDYMREWLRRPDFREMLPILLDNEDPEFVGYIASLQQRPSRSADPSRVAP